MRGLLFSLTLLLAIVPVTSAVAAGSAAGDAVLATAHQFVNGLNKGDAQSALAACAPEASIIDEFPPHHWLGQDACSKWLNAFGAYDKAHGVTGDFVTIGKPKVMSVSGNYAYVVLPATYRFKQHGKPMMEDGATLTVAFQKMSGAWRITGWAWTHP